MSTARSTIRQTIGRLLGTGINRAIYVGTPDGTYATTTFGCAALALEENDFFIDWFGRFYAGTHKDIDFEVTDSAKTNGVITFTPTLGAVTDATDLFELHRFDGPSPAELNTLINMAIQQVETWALEDKVDDTKETVASTYVYDLPTGFYTIEEIYFEESTADLYKAGSLQDPKGWKILRAATERLWLDQNIITITATRNIRIVGQSKPAALSTDAGTTNVDPAYIVQQVLAWIYQAQGNDKMFAIAQAIADRERKKIYVRPRGQLV